MSASSSQRISAAGFPMNGTPREKMRFALKYAMLAPTGIDWQPWEFQVEPSHIELIARNPSERHPVDPEGRELMIGCGSALLHLKLALKHFGCLGRLELFPDLDRPTLVAKIHFGSGRERDEIDKQLFEVASRQPAAPGEGEESPVSEGLLAALRRAVDTERGWVEFAHNESSRKRLIDLAYADRQTAGVGRFSNALAGTPAPALDNQQPQEAGTSVPAGKRTVRLARTLLRFKIRRTESQEPVVQSVEEPPDSSAATLAVVKTKTDDKRGWLTAGQAMARIILQAQALGLTWSFFNQPVRRRHVREALRTGIGHKGFAQVILRLGSASAPTGFEAGSATTSPSAFQWQG